MGVQSNGTSFQGPGQEPKPSAQPVAEPKPAPTTIPRPNELGSEALSEVEERIFRRVQGLVDKTNATVLKKVQQDLSSLNQSIELQKKAGIPITDAQVESLKNQIIQKALTESPPASEPAPPGQPTQTSQSAPQERGIDPVTAEALAMQQEAGIWIADTDPEVSMIKNTGGVREYLNSIGRAIEAKRKREPSTPTTSTPSTNQTPAMVRTPTSVGSTGTAQSLMQEYQQESKGVRRGSPQMLELRKKYRGKGLNV